MRAGREGAAQKGRGFTLLELLVVMAIIAVLATLAAGSYGTVTTMRNQTESSARLRQWGVALGSYVADHDGSLPRRGQGVQPVTQLDRPEDWFNALPPLLGERSYGELVKAGRRPRGGDRSIFIRPGAKDPGGPVFLSYGMNMNLSPWNLPNPTRVSQLERPAVTVFLAESPGAYASTYPSPRPYGCLAPHGGRGNILFLDGHVAAFTAEYLGVGRGDPRRDDLRWLTGTASDAQAPNY
jgi:prepilin-type N-terminal cleavage/methylation domain-containing protein/prepilin-type processing-associated H-X9-DG protein